MLWLRARQVASWLLEVKRKKKANFVEICIIILVKPILLINSNNPHPKKIQKDSKPHYYIFLKYFKNCALCALIPRQGNLLQFQ